MCFLSNEIKAKISTNCIGLHCPMPAVNLKLGLEQIKVGEILELTATDPATEKDIPAMVEHLGHELLKKFSTDKEIIVNGTRYEKEFHYFVRKLK